MSTKFLLGVLVILFSLGFGYFVFVYRPQELKARCLEVASFYAQGTETGIYGRVGEGKRVDEEIYTKCFGNK